MSVGALPCADNRIWHGVPVGSLGIVPVTAMSTVRRVPGIGSVQVLGAGQYAMRLWVKPDQLATRSARSAKRVHSSCAALVSAALTHPSFYTRTVGACPYDQ